MRIAALIFALLFALPVLAQQKLNYYNVDSLSYAYYTKNDTKNLRKIVMHANKAGVDFYYLHMRSGIAHYNKGNFEEAYSQFDKALKFFPIDTLAAEYLYFSYANSARSFDANRASGRLLKSQRERYGIKLKPIQTISIGGGYAFSDNAAKNGQINLLKQGSQTGFGDAYMLNNTAFGQVGMVNNISKNIKLFTAYSYYNLQNVHRIQNYGLVGIRDTSGNYTTTQHDVYLSPTFYLGKGFYISPAFHYIKYKFTTYTRIFSATPPPTIGTVSLNQDLIFGGAELGYRFKYAGVSLSGGVSKLDTLTLYHGNLGFTYYPLGNTSLYGTSNLLYMMDQYKSYYAFTQKVGVKLFKGTWLEAGFATGKLRYFAEGNGYTIYTTPDEITMKLSGMLNIYLSKHLSLSAGYIYLQRQGQYLRSVNTYSNTYYPINYTNHLVTTTLTITP